MKTFMANPQNVERKWYVVDAEDMILGRLASEVAAVLRGKNKPTYTPHVDCGDYVIVVNCDKVRVTGKKATDKLYRRHTGYAKGFRETAYRDLVAKKPTYAVELAVKGMLPKTNLGRKMLNKLKVYKGPEHQNAAQKPEVLVLKEGNR